MICTAIVPGIDSFNYYYTLGMTPMFLFSGIFFPLDALHPAFVRVAFFTPLFHLTTIARALSSGSLAASGFSVLWLAVAALILAWPPFVLMRRRIIK
jgi:lipooligosaccharide transport system permease protein